MTKILEMREYLISFLLLSADWNEKKNQYFSLIIHFTFISSQSSKYEKKDEIVLNWISIGLALNKVIQIVS